MKLDLLNEFSLLRDALKEEHEAYRGPHAEDAGHCSFCLLLKRADGILARCSSPDFSAAPDPRDHGHDDESGDVFICADCGRAFLSGNRRDDHFMSDDCKWQGRYDEEGCEAHKSKKIARAIAVQFAVNLDAEGVDLKKVDKVNKTPEYKKGSICASHDQCDANMPMLEAFQSITGHDMDCGSEDDAHLWGKAWDFAKKTGFVKLAKEGAAA